MKKVLRFFLILLLVLFVFSLGIKEVIAETTYLIDSGGNYYFDYASKLDENYYSSLEGLNDEEFRTELHQIISSGEIEQFSYEALKTELKYLDEDPNNSKNILCILTGKSMDKNSFGGTGKYFWNREHIWPKAHGFNNEDLRPYTDLHHLRAAEAYTNSTFHNDYDYGVVTGGVKDEFGNEYVNKNDSSTGYGIYEPRDAVKGDIARMIMYMDIRYEGDSLSNSINLTISSGGTAVSETNGYLGDLETLINWHEQDPVDDLEKRRNDKVYERQGNRNPFIDHPEYANVIFGANYDPLEDDEYYVSYYVTQGEFTYVDNNHYKLNDNVAIPTINPTSSRYDYSFNGWETESGKIFDFSNDTIDSNLKLFATWIYTPLPATDMIERSNTLTGLHLIYENKKIEPKPIVQTTTVTIATDGYMANNATKNTSYSYDEFLTYNKDDIEITYETNNKSSVYVNAGKIRLYCGGGNGSGLRIESREGKNAKILSVDATIAGYKLSSGVTVGSIFSKTIAEDGSNAYLQNISSATKDNMIDVTKIVINYYVDTIDEEPVFDSIGLVFGLELSSDIYEGLINSGEDVQIGIKIDGVEYIVEVNETNDTKKITKEIIVSDYNKKYSAQFFVKIDGTYFYANSISHSVKTIAEKYISSHINDSVVYDNRIVLKYLMNI